MNIPGIHMQDWSIELSILLFRVHLKNNSFFNHSFFSIIFKVSLHKVNQILYLKLKTRR